jgi:hypothetical protein
MLTRGTHPFQPVVTAARANNSYPKSQHLRRELSGFTTHWANAGTIKKLEAEIKQINANPSLSSLFKYRNSVRLFAMIDHAKSCMEMRVLRAKAVPLSFNQILQAGSKQPSAEQKAAAKACERYLADMKEAFQKGRAVSREIALLQWVVFKSTVFAPRGDVPVKERLIRVPLLVRQVFKSTVNRILNPMAMKLLAWLGCETRRRKLCSQ